MGRRWKWFLRPGPVALDLTGQAVPDGDVPGRFRRVSVEHLVPELRVTSRCDGALVYERPEERSALFEVHWRSPAEDPRTRKCPDCRVNGTCPRADWADSIIVRCLRTYWR
ncbi:hypothetical protein GCM10029963_07900 [Micromonospora andamanensis]|uniref:hypothetical protein n=1 Tax=Micromonospora andamanensis TaxID=1287068 RepID=UPI001951EDB5|nr:hypothetical protein [Micromonospora andamanensis]GIJ43017.1 hypothetical protein Vwe01_63420 [Micromonospora andamanensis]